MSDILTVKMLGGFSIERSGNRVDDHSNRMRKVWLLLAYLIFSRTTRITQDNLLQLLSSGDSEGDPGSRIKAMFYRARTMLNQLGEHVGHDLILFKNGCYSWNTELPIAVDAEEFDRLCSAAAQQTDADVRLDLYQQALALYAGDFLPKLSSEPWVMPISTYYHQMYLNAVQNTLELLEQRNRWTQAVALCRRALLVEPYSEHLYQHLMRGLIALEDRVGALHAYEEMSELLFSNFGVMPSDESRQLYRDAAREVGGITVPAGTLRDMLKEPAGAKGALLCEYDFFRLLYQVQARAIIRSGDVVHIALLSLHGRGKKELPRRSLDTAMDNLQDVVVHGLRQGDIVTKCSVSQFIIMLPQANYENSCAVCQRIIRAFGRQHPHSPASITFSIHPLEPNLPTA
ncbi:MAG: bacterial transcriptional activator domain-containing protein [Oscillospiraceae bacterium]|nr:bacterial transcriptional activator domain-containing protein [Oscillospiraceae bacterium]